MFEKRHFERSQQCKSRTKITQVVHVLFGKIQSQSRSVPCNTAIFVPNILDCLKEWIPNRWQHLRDWQFFFYKNAPHAQKVGCPSRARLGVEKRVVWVILLSLKEWVCVTGTCVQESYTRALHTCSLYFNGGYSYRASSTAKNKHLVLEWLAQNVPVERSRTSVLGQY